MRCEWVFGLTAMWMHPHQTHLPMLADAAQKLLQLANEGADWPYAYIRMNDAVAHMLLSSIGHIGVMTGDLPSQSTCGHLHQIHMWQLLQCGGQVVCPDGLNGGLEPLVFNFKELPLWNVADMARSSKDPSMMDVDLGNAIHVASSSTQMDDCLGLTSRGTMEQLPLVSLAAPHFPLQYLTSRTQTPSSTPGAPPTENSLLSVRTEPVTPTLVATLPHSRVSTPQATPSSLSPGSALSIQPTGCKTPEAESTSLIKHPLATSESEPASQSRKLLQLQWRVTTALRELLTVRVSADCHCRELGLKAELTTCQNDVRLTKAETWLAEAKVWHAKAKVQHVDTAAALQQAHLNSNGALDWEIMAEEEWKHQACAEEISAALEAWPLENCWALIYPLQLLADGVSLGNGWHGVCPYAPHIGHTITQPWHQAVAAFIQSRHAQPRARRGGSLWLAQGAPHKKQNPSQNSQGSPTRGLLQGFWGGKSGKADLPQDLQSHVSTGRFLWPHLNFSGDGPGNKPFECWDIQGAGGLDQPAGTEDHQSCCKSHPKGYTVFSVVTPSKPTNIMGLKGIHSPKILHWQDGHSYCSWCGKEGQNEDTIVNYLRTVHYHLGLVCTLCMDFFATSVDTKRWHAHACNSMANKDKDWEEEESKNDNGDEDNGYLLEI